MRLRRLILERYGHLSGVELSLADMPDLHIVAGANEAGKSTALSAIGDGLFRFPHSTPFDFLHRSADLRVGLILQSRDGRQDTFFRRKGRQGNDLFDAADSLLPEAAIGAFLSGATRERFTSVFGLNGAALRDGGKSILQGKGEVGQAILGAATGFHHLRDVLGRLDDEASNLFGDRRSARAFNQAARRHTDARKRRDELRIDHTAWKAVEDAIAALQATRHDTEQRMQALHTERTRLNRIRGTDQIRRTVTKWLAEVTELGPVPNLPSDAKVKYHDAIEVTAKAETDLGREQKRLAELEEKRSALPEQAPILSVAEAIDSLAASVVKIADMITDREKQRLIAAQRTAAMQDEGRSLGLALDAEQLAAAIPNVTARGAVTAALQRYERLSGRQSNTASRLADATANLDDAAQALDRMPQPEASADLRAAINAVRGEGRLDDLKSQAEAALRTATLTLDEALAALPLWHADAAALAAVPVPMDAEIALLAESLKDARDAERDAERGLRERHQKLAKLDAAITADTIAGPLPTRTAIQAARSHRDQAWGFLRRAYLDGGAALTRTECDAAGLGVDPAAGFEALIQIADRLVDRRAEEQERVIAAEQRAADRVTQQAMLDHEAHGHAATVAHRANTLEAWRVLWRQAGIEPEDDPSVMREWAGKRAQVLETLRLRRDAQEALDRTATRQREAFALLAALLPAQTSAANSSVAMLLLSADGVCKAREEIEASRDNAAVAVSAAAHAQKREHIDAAAARDDWADWRQNWASAAAGIALAPDAEPDAGTEALMLWDRIDKTYRERRDVGNRIQEMTQAIDGFDADTASVVQRIAPDMARDTSLDAIRVLAGRLTQARQADAERQRLTIEADKVRDLIAQAQRDRQSGRDVLDRLQALADAPDDEGLRHALTRWATHNDLTASINDRLRELDRLNDGKSLAELAAEAEGIDIDSLRARIDAIDAELKRLHEADQETVLRLHDLRRQQAEMEQGRDAAAAQQDMEAAVAEMDDIAARYIPLRMAGVLLRAGMERYRLTQQRPLLRRAGELFRDLTEGRYERLDTEDDDKGTHVIARRPDGDACPAESLSEGTLDQLYLALRLAAIELEAQATEPLPFIGDDLLVNFDDRRARAALRVLADFARDTTQVILFTHHDHIAAMAQPAWATVHTLDALVPVT